MSDVQQAGMVQEPVVSRVLLTEAEHRAELTAYGLGSSDAWSIVQAPSVRNWMDQTRDRFSYRCLPLRQANELGFWILAPTNIYLEWNGLDGNEALTVTLDDPSYKNHIKSHFGSGIVSFNIPWLFKTNVTGLGLRVGGATNLPPPLGLYPLDGLVETWEQNSTFTMNWKVLVAGQKLIIKAGYPICALSFYNWWSYKVGFTAKQLSDLSAADSADYEAWRLHRKSVLDGTPMDDNRNHYTKGQTIGGERHKCPHWVRLHARPNGQINTARDLVSETTSSPQQSAKLVVQTYDLESLLIQPVSDNCTGEKQQRLVAPSSFPQTIKGIQMTNAYARLLSIRLQLAYAREPDFNRRLYTLSETTTVEDLKEYSENIQFILIQELKALSVVQGFTLNQGFLELEDSLCQ
jgi:hypothetical protein